MALLTIVDADIIKTARLDPSSTTDQADAAFVSGSEQAAIEATIQPAALADASLTPLLLRNVTKLLAAELLDMRYRAEGATGVYQANGVTIGQQWDHPTRLRTEANDALLPYRLLHGTKEAAFVGPDPSLTLLDVQEKLFGRTEANRLSSEDSF